MENNEFKKICINNRTCYYFDKIIKCKDFAFDNDLVDEKSHALLLYSISYKCLIGGTKPLRIKFDKIDRFI